MARLQANLDYTDAEAKRIKSFVRMMGHPTIQNFIKLAIEAKVKSDLQKLSPSERKVIETILERDQALA